MRRMHYPTTPVAILAALGLFLFAACSETPTDLTDSAADALGFDVVFSTIGDPGVTAGVPLTPTVNDYAWTFPSTNEANIARGWANVTWNSSDAGLGVAPLKFTQPRTFGACFEIRIDDEAPLNDPHQRWPSLYLGGSWQILCVGGAYGPATIEQTFHATSHVDVRMTGGAERDERFDWTRFAVMSLQSKDECKDGGWQAYDFKNQGQCIRYFETGKN